MGLSRKGARRDSLLGQQGAWMVVANWISAKAGEFQIAQSFGKGSGLNKFMI